jgi:hypothetical protein
MYQRDWRPRGRLGRLKWNPVRVDEIGKTGEFTLE